MGEILSEMLTLTSVKNAVTILILYYFVLILEPEVNIKADPDAIDALDDDYHIEDDLGMVSHKMSLNNNNFWSQA